MLFQEHVPWDLLPEGVSVTVVFAIVIVFLKHIRESNDRLQKLSQEWQNAVHTTQERYEKSLDRMQVHYESSLTLIVDNFKDRMDTVARQQEDSLKILARIEEQLGPSKS